MIRCLAPSRKLRPRNGNVRPAKFDPPPAQPMTMSGDSPAMPICSMASWPMTVWCRSTWLSTEPSAYFVSSRVAASSTASLMAMPSEPGLSGVPARTDAAVVGGQRRAGHDLRAVGLHQDPPVRLLVVARADHVDLDLEPEERAGEGERAAPLPGAGLGRDALDARFLVVEGLRDGGVRLVAAGRADALVLVVDVGRRIERLLEAVRPVERAGPVQAVGVADLLGDLDLALAADLLADQAIGKSGARSSGPIGCVRARMERRATAGTGRSAAMLYQARGILDSSRTNFVCRGSTGDITGSFDVGTAEPPRVAGPGDASLSRGVPPCNRDRGPVHHPLRRSAERGDLQRLVARRTAARVALEQADPVDQAGHAQVPSPGDERLGHRRAARGRRPSARA